VITDDARKSFEAIFAQAARTRLAPAAGASCEIDAVDPQGRDETLGPRALVLTIASIAFRLLFVLHFHDDETTREYYLGAAANRTLSEVFTETGNLCCGYMNQQLVAHFPDLGMSTPYELNSRCVDYIGELKPNHVWAYDVLVGGVARLGVTLCVCTKAPLDFRVDVVEETQSEGELELF
jgi:hypothetical protein